MDFTLKFPYLNLREVEIDLSSWLFYRLQSDTPRFNCRMLHILL